MIILKISPKGLSMYKTSFNMALVSPENQLVHTPTCCRDYLHDVIKAHVNGKVIGKNQFGISAYYGGGDSAPDVCMDKLRLLITLQEDTAHLMGNAMRTLNVIEYYADIAQSVYQEVYLPANGKHYLVEGSAEYVINPHLLSLLTFILRFMIKNSLENEIESAEAFIGKIDELRERNVNSLHTYSDMTIAEKCREKLLKVLKNRKQLFSGIEQKHFYPKKVSSSYHAQGGIASLCQGYTHNTLVNERVNAL